MGFLDNLLGRSDERRPAASAAASVPSADAQAVERYRYMLKTAPPETLEQAHAEAFARLTPEQRRMVLDKLAAATPQNERAAADAVSADDPQAMGRLATRTEVREPGFMERNFGAGRGAGAGAGGLGLGGSLLSSFAMGFVGSMVAQSFMSSMAGGGAEHAALEDGADGADDAGASGDDGGDLDGGGFDGGDFGGDF